MNWQSVAELTLNLIEDKGDKFITKQIYKNIDRQLWILQPHPDIDSGNIQIV